MGVDLWKRAVFIPVLLFSLYLLTDNDTNIIADSSISNNRYHHLAVLTALKRHRPSWRVYRSLLELNLLLWGAVVSLWLWNSTIGEKMVGHLLFQPAEEPTSETDKARNPGRYYQPVDSDDIFGNNDDPNDTAQPFSDIRDDAAQRNDDEDMVEFDASYESDGSVTETPPDLTHFDPPTARDVAGVAVDSLICILLSLFFFTFSSAEGGAYVDGMSHFSTLKYIALVAAPVFPLLLFLWGVVSVLLPWRKRLPFWKVISFTVGAPCYHVTFRDGFVGDIFTSAVRPMQDTAFTAFYLLSGMQGWWKQSYDLDQADLPLETNWLLHTCILPMCMVSPLWWRFCQNLRQSYENKKRWPYLGNALKYFIAAEVAMFGVFDPNKKQTILWLSCFVIATLYQIWWDVFMDWELFTIEGKNIRLRDTRIYSVRWMYWAIFVINFVLRFCWTLSFLPPHYLNKAGVLSETFEGDLSHILDPTIASAEIIRRTLWGFLRVELEAIKVARKEPRLKGAWSDRKGQEELELKTMAMEGMEPIIDDKRITASGWISSDMYKLSDLQILGELCIYASIFTGLGLVAAAHRDTY